LREATSLLVRFKSKIRYPKTRTLHFIEGKSMASEILTIAGISLVLTLAGVALGYGILRITQGGAE
jgi:cytochrome b6-f complex subunit 7